MNLELNLKRKKKDPWDSADIGNSGLFWTNEFETEMQILTRQVQISDQIFYEGLFGSV